MTKLPWWHRPICDDQDALLVIWIWFAIAFGVALIRWALT